jgi:Bacterial protein of unknown function (DUF839)
LKKTTWIGAVVVGATAAVVVATTAFAGAGQEQGPSSSQSPYLVRTKPGIVTTSILTTGDAVDGYRMVGIPDGLGAYDNGDGTFTVLMNHELPSNLGVVRAHGGKGAFVSKWTIEKDGLKVTHGEDLIKRVLSWNSTTHQWEQIPAGSPLLNLGRLCSADLPGGALYDAATGLGTQERIFMDGEEVGNEGRPFGTVVTGPAAGSAYHLSSLGRMSFENTLAKPDAGATTIVAELEDAGNGQVYFYVGTKKSTGTEVDKAGLSGGTLYGLKIDGMASESDATTLPGGSARFSLVPLGDVSQLTGTQLDALSTSSGISGLNRPEDGSWDPSDAHNFYFNTTAAFNGISRIWKLRFDSPSDVLAGGVATIEVASPPFDPSKPNAEQAGPRMFDNMTVNERGQVISLEDVGNNAYLGGVYQYDPSTKTLARIAEHDPDRFVPGASGFITQDEESSGVIPAFFLGNGKYLIDVQNHKASTDPELVEGGQLLLLHIPPGRPVS